MWKLQGSYRQFQGILLVVLLVGLPLFSATADEVATYIEEGRQFLESGELRSAEIQLKNALQQDPANAQARYLLGLVSLQQRRGDAAIKELEYARRLNHPREDWLIPLARAYLLEGAHEALMEAIDVDPGDTDALQSETLALRGMAQIAMNASTEARDSFMRALTLDAENYDAMLGVSRLAMAEQDFDEARRISARLVEQNPDRYEGWILKGELDGRSRDLEAALEAFEKALQVQPGIIPAVLGRAGAALALNDTESAQRDVDQVLEVLPDHPTANFIQARLLLLEDDLEAADLALRRVIRVAPDHMPSFLLLGILHYSQGNYAQAESHLLRFTADRSDHLPARKLLAATEMKLRSPGKAVETLEEYLKGNPDTQDAQFLALLGSAYLQNGNSDLGTQYLQQAAEIAPDVSAIRTQLALSHLATGATDAAVTELESAVDLGQGLMQADMLLVMANIRNGNHTEAINVANALVDKVPDDPTTHNLLGLATLEDGDTEGAITAFRQAIALQPGFTTAWLNLARAHMAEQNSDAAAEAFRGLLAENENSLEALVGLAGLAEQAGQREEGLALLERAWEAHPNSLQTGVLLVRKYLENQQGRQALNMARTLRTRFPDAAAVDRSMGLALLANDQPEEALATLEEIVEDDPDSPEIWQLIAISHGQQGHYERAIEALDQALALDPGFAPALVTKVRFYLSTERFDLALASAQRLQENLDTAAEGFKLQGDILSQQEDFTAAADAYRQGYELIPSAQLALLTSNALRRAEDPEGAVTALRNWLSVQPADQQVRLQLSMYLDRIGRQEDAIAEYEQLLDQHPDNIVALNNLAWLYHQVGDERAVARAERAVELAPERPEIADTLGWILVNEGELQRGLVLLQQAALQGPDIPDIRYHLAVAYQKADRLEEARKELQRVLETDAAFSRRAEAEALLAELGPE